MYKAGIAESAINTQDIGFTQVAAVQQGQVDAAVIYLNNEPIQLRAAGFDVNVMAVSDYVSIVSNGIVTNEKTIRERPELVRGFVRALLRGLKDALADPEAAFTTSTRFVDGLGQNPDTDAAQRQVLNESLKMWQTETPGQTDPADWDVMQDVLISMELLKEKIDPAQLFTNQFVDEVNR